MVLYLNWGKINALFTEIASSSEILSEKIDIVSEHFATQSNQIKGVVEEVVTVEAIAKSNQELSVKNSRQAKKLSKQRNSLIESSNLYSNKFLGNLVFKESDEKDFDEAEVQQSIEDLFDDDFEMGA